MTHRWAARRGDADGDRHDHRAEDVRQPPVVHGVAPNPLGREFGVRQLGKVILIDGAKHGKSSRSRTVACPRGAGRPRPQSTEPA